MNATPRTYTRVCGKCEEYFKTTHKSTSKNRRCDDCKAKKAKPFQHIKEEGRMEEWRQSSNYGGWSGKRRVAE